MCTVKPICNATALMFKTLTDLLIHVISLKDNWRYNINARFSLIYLRIRSCMIFFLNICKITLNVSSQLQNSKICKGSYQFYYCKVDDILFHLQNQKIFYDKTMKVEIVKVLLMNNRRNC